MVTVVSSSVLAAVSFNVSVQKVLTNQVTLKWKPLEGILHCYNISCSVYHNNSDTKIHVYLDSNSMERNITDLMADTEYEVYCIAEGSNIPQTIFFKTEGKCHGYKS